MVGHFCFRIEGTSIKANGTQVLPGHQRQGVGAAMWSAMIKKYKPKSISVSTISESGENLVRKMKAAHPEIGWDCW